VTCLALQGDYLASVSLDGTYRVWLKADGLCISTMTFMNPIKSVALQDNWVAMNALSTVVRGWYEEGLENGAPAIHERLINYHDVQELCMNRRFIIVISGDRIYNMMGKIHILDRKTLMVYNDIVCEVEWVPSLSIDEERIVTATAGGRLIVYDFSK
jgi:WD40 repeat protein